MRPRRLQPDRITVLFFLAVVFLPLAGGLFRLDTDGDLREKRTLAARPSLFTGSGINRQFPKQFNTYYDDHFAFRNLFIRGFSLLALILQDSPSQKVLLGRDGWLFYTGDRSVESYRGLRPHTREELEAFRSNIARRQEALTRMGVAYLYVIAPNKNSIYPEFLPDKINRVSDKTRLDLLADFLKGDPALHVLDLRTVLTRAKERFRVFHRTDSHWNDMGARVAAQEILKTLNDLYPQKKPFPLKDLASLPQIREAAPGGDLAQFMGLEETVREEELRFAVEDPRCERKELPDYLGREWPIRGTHPVKLTCAGGTGTLVMTMDSFGNGLRPILSTFFRESYFVWPIPLLDLPFPVLEEIVLQEQPAVVIEEHVERYL